MANVKNLSIGSTGDEVKQLQTALGFTGSDVDGIFGKKTQQAVIDYQKANDLTVDGIAGKNTQGKLYGNNGAQAAGSNAGATGNNAAPADAAPAATAQDTFTYPDHTVNQLEKSDTLKQAETILQEYESTRPGEWVDPYRDKYMGYLEQYENRDPFSYDFNSDALYQQYKDQYVQQGQMAMMDTMGQAAALTGGYGSSYAQTAGQQVYNQYLGQLNEVMPELYQMAYERYGQEGQEMLDMFSMYLGLSEQDYGRHQDSVDNWYQEMARLTDNVNTLYGREWDQYALNEDTRLNLYTTGRSEAFADHQTAQNQAFTSSEAEKDRAFTREENEKSRNFTASQNAAKGSGDGNKDTGKTTMSRSDQQEYMKDADKLVAQKGVDGLYEIGLALEREGYSQEFIESWIEEEMDRLFPDNGIKEPETSGGGGPSGGTMYYEVR